MMTLDQLSVGKRACVIRLSEDSPLRQRLQDLGVVPGAQILAWMKSPLGDPTAFLISGAVIAIRREDASYIEVSTI